MFSIARFRLTAAAAVFFNTLLFNVWRGSLISSNFSYSLPSTILRWCCISPHSRPLSPLRLLLCWDPIIGKQKQNSRTLGVLILYAETTIKIRESGRNRVWTISSFSKCFCKRDQWFIKQIELFCTSSFITDNEEENEKISNLNVTNCTPIHHNYITWKDELLYCMYGWRKIKRYKLDLQEIMPGQ